MQLNQPTFSLYSLINLYYGPFSYDQCFTELELDLPRVNTVNTVLPTLFRHLKDDTSAILLFVLFPNLDYRYTIAYCNANIYPQIRVLGACHSCPSDQNLCCSKGFDENDVSGYLAMQVDDLRRSTACS